MIGVSQILLFDDLEPGVFTRRLVKVIVDTDVTHQLPFLFYLPCNPTFNREGDDKLAGTCSFHHITDPYRG
jgi:hypothetical protein